MAHDVFSGYGVSDQTVADAVCAAVQLVVPATSLGGVETTIELFGANRCMFESNFPVDKITSGYGVLWNAFKVLAAKASPSEKTALFSGTASRVYKLALT